ncbi:DMT family transporter [Klebsiella electrica]
MIGYIAMKNTYTTGVMCCLLATLSWGATFPIMTSALTRCDPYTFTTLRYGFAGLALVVALSLREGRQGLSLKGQRVGLAWLLGTAVIAGFIGILCWNMDNKILTPMNGVLFMDVVPLTAFSISAMTGAALLLNNLYLRYRGAKTVMLARPMQEERLPRDVTDRLRRARIAMRRGYRQPLAVARLSMARTTRRWNGAINVM